MEAEITKELIFEHFANRSTPLQRRQIDAWLHLEANEELYYQWLEEWENNNLEYLPQSEQLIQRYLDFLHSHPVETLAQEQVEVSEPQVSFRRFTAYWYLAAAILIMVGASLWIFRAGLIYQTYHTQYGEVKSWVLPDGSKVTLNANSTLKVPRWGFGQHNRKVHLQGEGFFAVTHLKHHQKFIVQTPRNLEVVVLGTEFSVFARARGAKVILNKGKVKINYQKASTQQTLILKPGDVVAFDEKNQMSHRHNAEPSESSDWAEKRFNFQATPLSELALILQETYGLQVSVDSSLLQRKLMGSFHAENVDEFLQAISELMDIQIRREGKQIQLIEP
ncbi:FecR family protein [Haliscomenobacter sp.]|uniref:FecR family protein n=1 Tax=Haliscomenobacter sp. TaxID=2717303 RepID=UPI003BAB0B98